MNAFSLMFFFARLTMFVVYAGMLVFALTRAKRNPRGAALVAIAALVMLLSMGVVTVVPMLLARVAGPESMANAMGVMSLLATAANAFGLCLLTWAALGESTVDHAQNRRVSEDRSPNRHGAI